MGWHEESKEEVFCFGFEGGGLGLVVGEEWELGEGVGGDDGAIVAGIDM